VFLPGETVTLTFSVPVTSISAKFVSSLLTPANAYNITTSVGTAQSSVTPDSILPDGTEIYTVTFSSATPFSTATFGTNFEEVYSFNIDDITYIIDAPINTYELAISKAGTGGGTVTGTALNCGATCAATYNYGTSITLTATPDATSTFTGWSGDCTGTGTCSVTMDSAKNVTATFARVYKTLSTTVNGSGSLSSSPAGISCGSTCSAQYVVNSSVSLTPTPSANYHFTGWSGDCSGTGSCNISMSADRSVTASFAIDTHSVTPSSGGNGTITPVTSNSANHNTTLQYTLIPDTGYHISTVGGTCGGSLSGSTYTTNAITADCTIIGNFTINQYTVTTSAGAHGTITPVTSTTGNYGNKLQFTITPDTGYSAASVAGCNGSSVSSSLYETGPLTGNCTVSASFSINSYNITAAAPGGNGTVTCDTPVTHGTSSTCAILPVAGYHLTKLTDNGSDLTGNVSLDSYVLSNVTAAHTIEATFSASSFNGQPVTSTGSSVSGLTGSTAPNGSEQIVFVSNGTVYYQYQDPTTGIWGTPQAIGTGSGPVIPIGANNVPSVAWISGGQVVYATNNGGTWSTPVTVGGASATWVDMAVDANGTAHIVYADPATDSDPYNEIVYLTNSGGTFGSPTVICDGSTTANGNTDCFTPLITVDAAGKYHIVYSSQTIDTTPAGHDPQYMVYTTNAGSGMTNYSHDLNPSATGTGTPQYLTHGSLSYNPISTAYELTYSNGMEGNAIWFAADMAAAGNGGTWSETRIGTGTQPTIGVNPTNGVTTIAYVNPNAGIDAAGNSSGSFGIGIPVAASGSNPVVDSNSGQVLYQAPDGNGIVQIYASGLTVLARLTPAAHNFGNTARLTSATQQFTMTNTGTANLHIGAAGATMSGDTSFTISSQTCQNSTLAPGGTCQVTVRFLPTTTGIKTANVSIASNDPFSPATSSLTGTGVPATYVLTLLVNGTGNATATAGGYSTLLCSAGSCNQNYTEGTGVALSATPGNGQKLAGWSGVCTGTGACQVTMDSSKSVTATFTSIIPHNGIVVSNGTMPTIADAQAVLQYVSGQRNLSATQLVHADVAPLGPDGMPMGNGVVDMADVIIILRRAVGIGTW